MESQVGGLATFTPELAPSGRQYVIAHGDHRATIVEVGAAVREYRVADRDVFQGYAEDEVSWAFHGTVLVPWPNRIADGCYEFDGEQLQLPITEPERNCSLHGLGSWVPWSARDHEQDRVTMELRLLPSPGYPFHLHTSVEYVMGPGGLTVTSTSTNAGSRACPYGIGFHAYAAAAPGTTIDDCTLQLDVRQHFVPDARLIPTRVEAVDGGPLDFLTPASLSGRSFDDGFGAVIADASGRSWARLAGADGRTVAIWAGPEFGYWQAYSGDYLPPSRARRSVALEPMTAAPNAFVSGDGLIRLEPGQSVTTVWGATLL
jgi:aldose 1-epimerase